MTLQMSEKKIKIHSNDGTHRVLFEYVKTYRENGNIFQPRNYYTVLILCRVFGPELFAGYEQYRT